MHNHMRPISRVFLGTALTAMLAGTARAQATMSAATMAKGAQADSTRHSFVQADVDYMTGMIHHHAQAIVMARWAPTHGASPAVRTLCDRIINSQQDEILTMQRWLRDHGITPPEGTPQELSMHGHGHGPMMPGMLTHEQMTELDSARGPEFDQLFLRYMIQHHTGALTMSDTLFNSYGAAQDDLMYKIASEIVSDQTTEIDRMRKMLGDMLIESWRSQ